MKLIVAGSRTVTDFEFVTWETEAFCSAIKEVVLVSGRAQGPDTFAFKWAWDKGVRIESIPADWGRHGISAGILRNREMARVADGLLAFWDGQSSGTRNMVELMVRARKPWAVILVSQSDAGARKAALVSSRKGVQFSDEAILRTLPAVAMDELAAFVAGNIPAREVADLRAIPLAERASEVGLVAQDAGKVANDLNLTT